VSRLPLFAALLLAASAFSFSTARAEAPASSLVVTCLDEARNVVTRTAPGACAGRVLSAEEAQRFEEERVRRRESTMREQMERTSKTPRPKLQRTGSGVIVSTQGHVLTNRHVVDGCREINVAFGDGAGGQGTMVREDPTYDLAILRTDLTVRSVAAFRSDLTKETGLRTSVVGYPSEGMPTIRPSLAPVVLNDRGDDEALPIMTVVGRVRSGHSGSPILDEGGNIIGLIFAKPDEVAIYRQSGKLIDDMGLAIPTPVVLNFLRRAEVRYVLAENVTPMPEERLLEAASGFVVRIACY
jgi:S1-C subfamily serine protease